MRLELFQGKEDTSRPLPSSVMGLMAEFEREINPAIDFAFKCSSMESRSVKLNFWNYKA